MYDEVGFYNHYGNGDIFESREFVRKIMEQIPAREYVYYMGKSPRLMMDFHNLIVDNDVPSYLDAMSPYVKHEGNLYINTWIGRDSKYVLPGIGCTIEMLFKMYNDILWELKEKRLPGKPLDYLTTVDYSYFDIEFIKDFMLENMDKKKIYISNGSVQSSQAVNFDMGNIINKLAGVHSDKLFFITQPMTIEHSNIIDCNSLTPKDISSNLNELSYLSTYCDIIIGRNSGPQVFAWTKDNCFSKKVNITFSKSRECAHFVYNSPITMIKYWSDVTDEEQVFKLTNDVISKELG